MASSLSNLVNNLAEGIHKIKCKKENYNKKWKISWINYKDFECCLEYTKVKDYSMQYKCFLCNRDYQKKFDENLFFLFSKKSDLLMHTNLAKVYLFKIQNLVEI